MFNHMFNHDSIVSAEVTSSTTKLSSTIPFSPTRSRTLLCTTKSKSFMNWYFNFEKLLEFRKKHHHSMVPLVYPEDPSFARWVKRQRFNHQLMLQGKQTTLDQERYEMLTDIGFIWDAKEALWESKLHELKTYKKIHGNCSVPVHYPPNPALGTWVKFQRRQYKLYKKGCESYLTLSRILALEEVGFSWELRRRHADSTQSKSPLDSDEYRGWVEIYSDLHAEKER